MEILKSQGKMESYMELKAKGNTKKSRQMESYMELKANGNTNAHGT